MASHDDRLAQRIPWYVMGRLAADDARRLEVHLTGCEECTGLLALARLSQRVGAESRADTLEHGHIQSQLLVRYHEDPHALDEEVRARLQAHLDSCALCSGVLPILSDLASVEDFRPAEARRPATGRIRRFLLALLGPRLALAYLVALLIVLPAYLISITLDERDSTRRGPARTLAGVQRLESVPTFRSEEGAPVAPVPVELVVSSEEEVLFELVADVDPEDLANPSTRFSLELSAEDETVWTVIRESHDFDRRGVLRVLVDTARLDAGRDYRFVLRHERPGDPDDGLEVFSRAFRVRRE